MAEVDVHFVVHPEAAAELTAAGDWYEAQRPGLGADLLIALDRAFETIMENPQVWPLWPGVAIDLDVRRFLLPRFPFAVAYVIDLDRVIVLAVAHTRRRPGYWARRRAGGTR